MSSEPIHPLISMIRRLNRRLVDWIDVPHEADGEPIGSKDPAGAPNPSVVVERTPNPNAMKYLLPTAQTPRTLTQNGDATDDPFAPLLSLEGVRSVFVMESFLTVLKAPTTEWDGLSPQVVAFLEDAGK